MMRSLSIHKSLVSSKRGMAAGLLILGCILSPGCASSSGHAPAAMPVESGKIASTRPAPAQDETVAVRSVKTKLDGSAFGVYLSEYSVTIPADCKITVFYRVYDHGKLDKHSYRFVKKIRSDGPWQFPLRVGHFDPDAVNPKPSSNIKLLIFAAEVHQSVWLNVKHKDVSTTSSILSNEMKIGREIKLCNMLVGQPWIKNPNGGMYRNEDPNTTDAEARVAVSFQVDRLTEKDLEALKKNPDSNATYDLKE